MIPQEAPAIIPPGYCTFDATCASANEQAGHSTSGCTIDDGPGFQTAVACGTSATAYTCGECSAVGGTAPVTAAGTRAQGCH